MLPRTISLALAAIAVIFAAAGIVNAQDVTVPMPDSSYGDAANSYPSPTDLAMPAPDDLTNPNSVTIPIPGGGDITVDGPDAPPDRHVSPLPGSQWGNQQQNPFSHGTGPVGP
ncbi:MAG TPA: hypothetical protein VEU51_06835 [Candidatus Acidoferrales bacterium]|nr:hypothetical protein [Candidatus Acidoferrales bacterium]